MDGSGPATVDDHAIVASRPTDVSTPHHETVHQLERLYAANQVDLVVTGRLHRQSASSIVWAIRFLPAQHCEREGTAYRSHQPSDV
jgi:hypothetical protein